MMKVCSFLPAATRMIYDMGLQEALCGVTFECHGEALQEKPAVVRCRLAGQHHSSAEIDALFSASRAGGENPYYVEGALLEELAPDIIFTQDVCDVCGIDSSCTTAAIAHLPRQPRIVPLTPKNLDDVFDTALTIAAAMGREEAARSYLADLNARRQFILERLREHSAPLRRVSLLEWIDPVYNCGHWIPYQIAGAGGTDLLGNPGGYSVVTPWEKILRYDPEVLIIAPCGFHTGRAAEELHLLTAREGWESLQAVKEARVYLLDFDLFTQPSPGTLTDGIELLAALFHPELFSPPERLEHKYRPIWPKGQ